MVARESLREQGVPCTSPSGTVNMRAPTGSVYSNRFDITRGMSPMAMGSVFKKDGPSPSAKASPKDFN